MTGTYLAAMSSEYGGWQGLREGWMDVWLGTQDGINLRNSIKGVYHV